MKQPISGYDGAMLGRTYDNQLCSVARALEIVGERWTLLILRDIFFGIHRFDEIQASLGIARNILTTRLEHLVDEGVVERRPYKGNRAEYHLTKKGRDLWPPLLTLMQWGDEYYTEKPPRIIKHRGCGGRINNTLACRKCGKPLRYRDLDWEWGPGADEAARASTEAA